MPEDVTPRGILITGIRSCTIADNPAFFRLPANPSSGGGQPPAILGSSFSTVAFSFTIP